VLWVVVVVTSGMGEKGEGFEGTSGKTGSQTQDSG